MRILIEDFDEELFVIFFSILTTCQYNGIILGY